MLHFFRKIRRDLLANSQFFKYLKYAIGEIILVVLGILIALQINNLNEERKQRVEEINILKGLKKDFQSDIRDFKTGLREYNNISTSIDQILKILENNETYNDSLDKYFAQTVSWPLAVIHKNSFDALKSKGVSLISNDSLRQAILFFHGTKYTSIKNWESSSNRDIYFEEMIKRFDKVEPWKFDSPGKFSRGKMKPNNYAALRTDTLYMSILRTMKRDAEDLMNGRYFNVIQDLENLIIDIDKEVDRLDNMTF